MTIEEWRSAHNAFEFSRYRARRAILSMYWKYSNWYLLANVPFQRRGQNHLCLDVGCGVGRSLCNIVKTRQYVGLRVDPSISSLRRLLRRTKKEHLAVFLVHAVGEYLPLRSSCVPLVTIGRALDHVMEPAQVMREVHRVLHDKGTLLILQLVPGTSEQRKRARTGHLRVYAVDDLCRLMENFKITKLVLLYGLPLPVQFVRIASRVWKLIDALLPYSPSAIILACKSTAVSRDRQSEV